MVNEQSRSKVTDDRVIGVCLESGPNDQPPLGDVGSKPPQEDMASTKARHVFYITHILGAAVS